MKLLPLILSALIFTGCGIIPKKVEFFQKKIQRFPDETSNYVEAQKQAASLAKTKAQETLAAALIENASPNVVVPATDTAHLTDAVSASLGPPKAPVTALPDVVAAKLLGEVSRLDRKIDAFKQTNDSVAGKKIEGTGLFQIPYFVYVGLLVLVVVVGWHLAKLVLTGLSAANPGFSVAVGGMNVAGSIAAKGFNQLVTGGEKFKDWVSKEISDPALQQKVLEAFATAHKSAQDGDVKTLVDNLTK